MAATPSFGLWASRGPRCVTCGSPGTTSNGEKKRTNWCGATLWGDDAEEAANSLATGSKISIRGRLRSEGYVAKDGTRRRVVKIVADQVQFEPSRRAGASEEAAEPPTRQGKRAA